MFHFCSHAWEVRDMEDGTLVQLTRRDLDAETTSVLVDELFELVQESGRPDLYLDFAQVHILKSVMIGKLIALKGRLREHGGRLILMNLDPGMTELLRTVQLTDAFEVRTANAADTIF